MARTAAAGWRRVDAHGILRWDLFCIVGELRHRESLRLAHDVCGRRTAGAFARLGAAWRDGAGEVETKGRRGSLRENLEAIFRPFLEHAAPPNGSEFLVYARIDLRFVGGNGLCARRGDDAGGSGRENRTTGSAAGFARGDAGFLRDDSWLPGDAVARGKSRAPRRAGGLFRADACVHCADVRKGFLSRSSRASVVFCLSFLSRVGRRQFRRVHALAAGAVSYGVPRQRICLFYLARAFCRRRDNISRGRRRRTLRLAGSSCRHDLDRLCGRLAARSFRRGNSRRMLARLTPHVGENMTEVASKVFPIEKLREFCIRVFLHCGVPKADATQAADVLACADLRGVDSHGVARMYSYFGMLSEGHINPKPKLCVRRRVPRRLTATTVLASWLARKRIASPWTWRKNAAPAGSACATQTISESPDTMCSKHSSAI